MTDATLIELRATVAMRKEDLRIARKHREEAAARSAGKGNQQAYENACRWEDECYSALQSAQTRLFAHPEHEVYGVRA